jgi:2-oxoglutarate dehydrogenase E2 component (dihydrolipoamide succinyltransferase)
MPTTVTMPQLGESVVEGTVVRWIAQPGQKVERDGPLVEVATDKANTEVPSPTAGVLVEVLAQEGAVVPVGAPLCRIDEAAQVQAAPKSAPPVPSKPPPSQPPQGGDGDGHLRASPVVRNVAQEHGIDLEKVSGSGVAGRITKADVLSYLDRGGAGAASSGLVNLEGSSDSHDAAVPAGSLSQPPPPRPSAPPPNSQPPSYRPPQTSGVPSIPPPVSAAPFTTGPLTLNLRAYRPPRYTPREGDQVIPFDHRRRIIAEHMVYSKVTSPHVPCCAEVDMTPLTRLREEWKQAKETGGRAPSFLVAVCRATVQALAEFPRMNAVVQDESVILRKDINLGVAVDTDKGLLVPVIRKANEKSVLGLGRALEDLAARARSGKVTADELSGGSFTVSNPGLKGNLWGASIINQPQVGILRMGEIIKRPVVREMDGEDAIVVRRMMYVTLSYDHRVIEGVIGNSFLHRVRELLEEARFTL